MSLDSLRSELAGIDRDLLELVAKRRAVSAAIGKLKHEAGLATRDYRQESDVVHRARRTARELGLSEDLAERLLLLLIESSLKVQEQDRVAAAAGGDGKRVLIIGGAGKMGRWFVRFLTSQGYRVEVADPAGCVEGHHHVRDWREATPGHDIVVVAAPLRQSNIILEELAAQAPPGLVFDIGSLKAPLRPGLVALVEAGALVTSLHPMFGPDTELLSGRHVIHVDLGVPQATERARALFDSTLAVRVDMDLDSHDRLIAWVLGLSHAVNIAFFSSLAASGEGAPSLDRLSSTTFDRQLQVASAVAGENPHLYYEIQALNAYGKEALDHLVQAVERLRSVVRAGDEEAFVGLMRRGRDYLGRLH